jgi:hypothetical protein
LRYGIGWAHRVEGSSAVAGLFSGDIELKYTLLADANLDGAVNGSDFSLLAANFGQGDSGADVSESQADIAALDSFAIANGLPLPTIGAVPEPGVGAMLLSAGLALRRRRRIFKADVN